MWEPPEYPGPCFDLHFDRFDGFIFEAEKPFENVCATGASPVQLREYGSPAPKIATVLSPTYANTQIAKNADRIHC